MMTCRVCSSELNFIFKGLFLKKLEISFYKCINCGFIQTENAFWLNDAYDSSNISFDTGAVFRNISMSEIAAKLIDRNFNSSGRFLDYGGGYGLFVRLMRDKGYDFYRQDKYSINIFAQGFDIADIEERKFEVLTAFEVFEHLVDPVDETGNMFKLADNILFSTELVPVKQITGINDWPYFMPAGGQHISFYTLNSLLILAELSGCHLYTNGIDLHLLTKNRLGRDPFKNEWYIKIKNRLTRVLKRVEPDKKESLIGKDFEFLQKKF